MCIRISILYVIFKSCACSVCLPYTHIIYTHAHTHTNTQTHTQTHAQTHTHTHTLSLSLSLSLSHTHTHAHTHTHTYAHTHTHTCSGWVEGGGPIIYLPLSATSCVSILQDKGVAFSRFHAKKLTEHFCPSACRFCLMVSISPMNRRQ